MRMSTLVRSLLALSLLLATGCSKQVTAPMSAANSGSTASNVLPSTVGIAGPITGLTATSLTVGTTLINVDSHTVYGGAGDPKSLADFKLGDPVRVLAVKLADGSLLALAVYRVPPPRTVLTGPITDLNAPDLSVGGRTVVTDGHTIFLAGRKRITFGDLKLGEIATVVGQLQADGSLLADLVRVHRGELEDDDAFTGTLEQIGTDGITVSGKRFAVDSHTVVTIEDHPAALADLKLGMVVEVRAIPRDDGLPPLALDVEVELPQ